MGRRKKRGRPSKYKPQYCQSLIRFFDIEPHFAKDITITKSDGTQIDKSEETASDIPFFTDWCHSIGISHETMMQWTEKHISFLAAYKRAKELQEKVLVTNGLLGLYSPSSFIFTAKNIIGWRDKQEISIEEVSDKVTKIVEVIAKNCTATQKRAIFEDLKSKGIIKE